MNGRYYDQDSFTDCLAFGSQMATTSEEAEPDEPTTEAPPGNTPPAYTGPTQVTRPEFPWDTCTVAVGKTVLVDFGDHFTDADGDTLTFSLVTGNPAVQLITDHLVVAADECRFDHESESQFTVTVAANDGRGGVTQATVTVKVTNIDERPFFKRPGEAPVQTTATHATLNSAPIIEVTAGSYANVHLSQFVFDDAKDTVRCDIDGSPLSINGFANRGCTINTLKRPAGWSGTTTFTLRKNTLGVGEAETFYRLRLTIPAPVVTPTTMPPETPTVVAKGDMDPPEFQWGNGSKASGSIDIGRQKPATNYSLDLSKYVFGVGDEVVACNIHSLPKGLTAGTSADGKTGCLISGTHPGKTRTEPSSLTLYYPNRADHPAEQAHYDLYLHSSG